MKGTFSNKISVVLAAIMLFMCMNISAAEAYTVNLYDGDTLFKTYSVQENSYAQLENGSAKSGKYFKGWKTADGRCLYAGGGYKLYAAENMDLYAEYGDTAAPAPGENIFKNPNMDEDFFDVHPANGRISYETENGNRILRYERASGYTAIQKYVAWDIGRKYALSFKIKTDSTHNVWYNVRYSSSGGGSADHGAFAGKNTADEWSEYSYTVTIPQDYVPSDKDAITFFSDPGTEIAFNDNLYDDLSLIPYYKLSYDINGGTSNAPEAEYTLETLYTINPSSTPIKGGYTFLGWADSPDSRTPVTSVEFDKSDITLYAIWELDESSIVPGLVTYSSDTAEEGNANGTAEVDYSESTDKYETADLYFGNEGGIFENYTKLESVKLKDNRGSYTMSGNRAFPAGSTRIYAVFVSADGTSKMSYCAIPEENRISSDEKPIVSFYSISDIHAGNDYWPEMPINRNNAAADIINNKPDFLAIVGDLVDHGLSVRYESLYTYLDNNFNAARIPTFIANGNHELDNINYQHTGYDLEALKKAFDYQLGIAAEYNDVSISREDRSLFYAASYKDYRLIFLSVPTDTDGSVTYSVSGKQLEWLDEQLYKGEKSNKTTFVFSHVALNGDVPGSNEAGITNTDEVRAVLNRHPNLVLITGHTHSYLDSDKFYTKVGNMTDNFSTFNDGCAVWLSLGGGTYFKDYSMGQFVEIYKDKILVKARQFTKPGKFISKGLYVIPTPDSSEEIGEASIDGEFKQGGVLSAKLNGQDPPEGSTYEWIMNGKTVGTQSTYTVDAADSAGKKLILRITLPNGSYASAVSDSMLGECTVRYDLNGGRGTMPPQDKALAGQPYTPYCGKYFPVKDGSWFIGWSENKNAAVPQESIVPGGDTALYAVYTDKPEFYFDANLSGWEPTYGVSSWNIKDSSLVLTTNDKVKDLFFIHNSANIDADKYKYLRIKMKLENGANPDCMFFETDKASYSQSKTRIPISGGNIIGSADGMNIYEFYIPEIETARDYWKGTVNKLRFDAIESFNGKACVDYIVFSDKKAVVKADISADEPKKGESTKKEAVLSDDSVNCTVVSACYDTSDEIFRAGKAYTLKATLKPKDGYTFMTTEDLKANVTVNGKNISDAVINDDGTAVISLKFAKLDSGKTDTDVSVWDGSVDKSWGEAAASTYEINSASQFIAFRDKVLGGENFANKKIVLNCDIDLNNLNLKYGVGDKRTSGWTEGEDLTMFAGTFDGNGHVIKNLSMNPNIADAATNNIENSYCVGLFFISSGAQLINLGLKDVTVTLHDTVPPEANYGGLLSINSYGTVSGCFVKNIKFAGGWTEDTETPTIYFAAIAARTVGGTIKNSYADGVDFTGIKNALFNMNARKTAIANASAYAGISNCYSANLKYNPKDTTDMSMSNPNAKVMNNFDSAVYKDDSSDISINHVYTDVPYSVSAGNESAVCNATGTLDSVLGNVEETLSDAFADFSSFSVNPMLSWEKKPVKFGYDECRIYKNYGKTTEEDVTDGTLTSGLFTVEISGIKNQTGIDYSPVVCFTYVSGGKLEKCSYMKYTLPSFSEDNDNIELSIDLSDIAPKTGDFAQVIVFSDVNSIVPLIRSLKLNAR